MYGSQYPTRREGHSVQGKIRDCTMSVKPDHREDAARPQEITEARKGWSQREVVQGRYSRDEVEVSAENGCFITSPSTN